MHPFSADDLSTHGDAMRRLARDLVADDSLADDAVQQAYVVALTRPPRERHSIAGWLLSVVRSCSLDLLRQRSRRVRREQSVEAATPMAADEVAAQLELQAAIVAAVRSLDEPYASAVWLRWFEGLSPSEIAARQGEPVKTIKTRLGRALQQLRNKLDARPGGRQAWIAALAPLAPTPVTHATAVAAAGTNGTVLLAPWLVGLLAASLMLATVFWIGSSALSISEPVPKTDRAGAERAAVGDTTLAAAQDVANSRLDVGTQPGAEAAPRRSATPAASDGGPKVQVRVRRVDGAPLPFAEVLYGVPAQVDEAALAADLDDEQCRRLRRDLVAWYARFGKRTRTDADGIARWSWSDANGKDRFWLCLVQHEATYAESLVLRSAPPDAVHEILLQADRNFVVHVVDAQQQPVEHVPVAATFPRRDEEQRSAREEFGTTDERGEVQVRHVQTWWERIAPRGAALPMTVILELPGIDVAAPVDANSLPDQPLVLSLPPCGSLRITELDAAGSPAVGQRWVLREQEGPRDRSFSATTDENGVACFPRVALGRAWQIGHERAPTASHRTVTGPRSPGEQVDVQQRQDPEPVLCGRLVQQGTPLASAAITMTAHAAGREPSVLRGVTDDQGRFVVRTGEGWRNLRLLELHVLPMVRGEGYLGARATWRGALELTAGTHDLGTLTLESEPIVVAGTLLPPAGVPLPTDVRLDVETANDSAEEAWRYVSLRGRLHPDGRFILFGSVPNEALRLVVTTANRFAPVPPLRFRAGDRGLHIELHRGGAVRASIVAKSPLAAFTQVPLLVPMDEDPRRLHTRSFDPHLDPRMARESAVVGSAPFEREFVWPAVHPGRYRLEIWARGLHRPLHVVPDLVVVDGQRNEDARLRRLVVPGLRTITLTLPQAASVAGPSPDSGAGLIAVLDGDRPAPVCWHLDGTTALLATVEPLDVLVRLHGHRDRIVRGVNGDQTIELEPGIPVRLRTDDYEVPAGHTLQIELVAIDDVLARMRPQLWSAAAGGSIAGYQSLTVASDSIGGIATMSLPAPGRHRVAARLRDASGRIQEVVVDPSEVSIAADGGTFSLRLRGTR